jgi:hypothetical protein
MLILEPKKKFSMLYKDYLKGYTFRLMKSKYLFNTYMLCVSYVSSKSCGYSMLLEPIENPVFVLPPT